MDIPGVGNTNTNASEAANSRTRLSDNYDTFLILLTAQLQNQDPLAPMDSTQFTQQLVQFSQVEQQIRTNEQLEGLVGQYNAAAAGAALSYLGKDAIIESDETYLAGEPPTANWAYRMPESATSLTIQVRDMQGRVVYETTTADRGAGEHLFSWDGKKTNGETAADGVYQITFDAENAEGTTIRPTVSVRETIMGVDFTGDTPVVITPAGTRELASIRSVLDNG
jgi:flagellar basal-body rod modification protein FlgD